jgi:hypothetical protein
VAPIIDAYIADAEKQGIDNAKEIVNFIVKSLDELQ